MGFTRKLHKWLGLAIGLQVLLWITSGLVMALLDPAKVSGRQWAQENSAAPAAIPSKPVLEPFELPSQYLQGALAVTLSTHGGLAVYRVRHREGEILLDAADGALMKVTANQARNLARADFTGAGEAVAVTPGTAPDLETRNHAGAYWRVDFADAAYSSIYVSASTGDILERRNTYWRAFDIAWMLHNMDYRERSDFNNALVIAVALVAAWFGASGFVLLFGSFKRRDFRFLSRRN